VASETSALATVELRRPRHELHRRLSDEQQRLLADLYRENASAIYFVCNFLLRKPEDAADATQEVFLSAVESLRERATAKHARAWLLTAAQNYCLEVLRGHQRLETIEANAAVGQGGEQDPESAVVERDTVSAVFAALRVRERQALWQWAVERRPLAEIARDLGLSYTAVQQLLFRARRHAASVAAWVAALLGLFQLGRVARRASQGAQLVLVAAVVPVVLASTPSSSGTRHPDPPPQGGREISSASPAQGGREISSVPRPQGGMVVVVNRDVVAAPVQGAKSTVNNAISILQSEIPHPDALPQVKKIIGGL
jgi:RNA polymerase sigma factor (sigma-70 family)